MVVPLAYKVAFDNGPGNLILHFLYYSGTTPQPCTDTPVNLEGSTFNHPTATTAEGTPVVCTLPAVTVTQCEGSCGSTSSPQIVRSAHFDVLW